MTSLLIEHLDPPATERVVRDLDAAGDRAGEVLAGRTVWCASAPHDTRHPADVLMDRLRAPGQEVEAGVLTISADGWLRPLARRLDGMLGGAGTAGAELGEADRALYGEGVRDGEALMGDGVRGDDVVVIHDPISALVAAAAREHGARAVWHLRITGRRPSATARDALAFLQRFTPGVDAYIVAWREPGRRRPVEYVAAAMPAAGVVAAEELPGSPPDDASRRLAWRMALAEVVRTSRAEAVGGTLQARPRVAAR